jgi:hypothetical protein
MISLIISAIPIVTPVVVAPAPVIAAPIVMALVMLPTFPLVPGLFGVVTSRQVDPGTALGLGVVPPVVIVIIVIAAVVIVGLFPQLHDGWQQRDAHHHIHSGRARRASH